MNVKTLCLIAGFLTVVTPSRASIGPFFQRDRSIEELQTALVNLPEQGHHGTKAKLYSELGDRYYHAGRFDEAAEAFRTSLDHGGRRKLKRHAYLYLAKSEESSGRFDEAIGAYQKALKFDKRNWKRARDLAWTYEQVQNYKKALEYYQYALGRNGGEGSLYFAVGRVWHRLGMLRRAEIYLTEARVRGIQSPELYLELSTVYEGMGRFNDATVAFEKVLFPSSPAADWARFVYLAVLAKNKAFANKGMTVLRDKDLSDQSWEFYETLVHASGEPFDRLLEIAKTDSSMRYLFNYVGGSEAIRR